MAFLKCDPAHELVVDSSVGISGVKRVGVEEKPLASGAQGMIYRVTTVNQRRPQQLLMKVFDRPVPTAFRDLVQRFKEHLEGGGAPPPVLRRGLPVVLLRTDIGRDAYLMPEAPGITLDNFLSADRLEWSDRKRLWSDPVRVSLPLAVELAYGVSYLHHHLRMVHADVNGKNILIDVDGVRATLLDVDGGCYAGLSQTPTVRGKADYDDWIQPRRRFGAQGAAEPFDQQDDAFALGVAIHSLLFPPGLTPLFFCSSPAAETAYRKALRDGLLMWPDTGSMISLHESDERQGYEQHRRWLDAHFVDLRDLFNRLAVSDSIPQANVWHSRLKRVQDGARTGKVAFAIEGLPRELPVSVLVVGVGIERTIEISAGESYSLPAGEFSICPVAVHHRGSEYQPDLPRYPLASRVGEIKTLRIRYHVAEGAVVVRALDWSGGAISPPPVTLSRSPATRHVTVGTTPVRLAVGEWQVACPPFSRDGRVMVADHASSVTVAHGEQVEMRLRVRPATRRVLVRQQYSRSAVPPQRLRYISEWDDIVSEKTAVELPLGTYRVAVADTSDDAPVRYVVAGSSRRIVVEADTEVVVVEMLAVPKAGRILLAAPSLDDGHMLTLVLEGGGVTTRRTVTSRRESSVEFLRPGRYRLCPLATATEENESIAWEECAVDLEAGESVRVEVGTRGVVVKRGNQ